MNYLAPSGTPISLKLLTKWFFASLRSGNVLSEFSEKIKKTYNIKHCLFVSSGRTALYLLLECLYKLKSDPDKKQVIIPSYTCFSVPGSIEKAGLETRVCDIDPSTLSYDLKQLSQINFENVLAIVTSNLYGIPNNLPEIEKIAKQHNVYLIDDAAQCLGGIIGERYSGTFGDVGLFSLDKGKNITSIQGGIIVTNSDAIAGSMKEVINGLPEQTWLQVATDCFKLLIYALLLPPNRYWIITKLPFLGLGLTPYTTDYPVHQYSRVLGAMANLLFNDLQKLTESRVSNAEKLLKKISLLNDIKIISYQNNMVPVFLRLPILIKNPDKRLQLLSELHNAGIGATASYPTSVVDIQQIHHKLIKDDVHAIFGKQVANQILTLPTHPYTSSDHISKMYSIFEKVLG